VAGSKTATKLSLKLKPIAARYLLEVRSLEIEFENGSSYRYPVDRLDFSRWNGNAYIPLEPRPTDADLEAVVLWPNGEIVEFENIDQGFEVAQLISELIS
jgi:hypothetical protein